MNPGILRQKVTLQRAGARVDDGYGGGSISYADITTLYAAIKPLAGRELFLAGQWNPSATIEVRVRYYPGIKPSDRLVYTDEGSEHVLDIKTVSDIENRHREVVLMCEELLS